MKIWAIFILSFGLFFLDGCGEIQPNPKSFQTKKIYHLKVIRVAKRTPRDRSVIDIDGKTLREIVKTQNIKKGSMQYRVLKLLKKINIDESLNLKSINSNARDVKEFEDEFIAIGLEYYKSGGDGYILYFDKDSLDVKKMVLFKGRNILDVSSDMTKVLLCRVKHDVKYIELYSFDTNKFKSITKRDTDIGDVKFSTKDNYVVVTNQFKTYGNNSATIEVYSVNSAKSLFRDVAHGINKKGLSFQFAFSPNEKYFFITLAGRGASYRQASLYKSVDFKRILKFYEKKSKDDMYGWSRFLLNDSYLVFIDKGEIYDLKTKKLTDKVYFGFREPSVLDKKMKNLFYAIGTQEIDIYYIKDGIAYALKRLAKDEDFTKDAMVYKQKLYLYQAYSDGKFQIIDIPKLDIARYDFKLARELKKAKNFYNAGFKAKAIEMYKRLVKNRDFDTYFMLGIYNNYISIHAVVNLEKYKYFGDLKALAQYTIYALEYNYMTEALKGLSKLRKSKNKELYTLVNAIYLIQTGKEREGYGSLVQSMPFSQEIVDLVLKNANSYLKFYQDKDKISLLFGIDKSKIIYQKLNVNVDFVDFDAEFIDSKNRHTKKQNITKLLDKEIK